MRNDICVSIFKNVTPKRKVEAKNLKVTTVCTTKYIYTWSTIVSVPSSELGPNSDDWRKSLALSLLCGLHGIRVLYICSILHSTLVKKGCLNVVKYRRKI